VRASNLKLNPTYSMNIIRQVGNPKKDKFCASTGHTQKNGVVSNVTTNLFFTLHRHSGNCPSFSCAISSSLLLVTARPRYQFPRWCHSRRRLSVRFILRCPDLWLKCGVSFMHNLKKTVKPCTKLMLHCNHRSGYLKTGHTESILLLQRHLGSMRNLNSCRCCKC
jgi:hypothetical protein